jgi:hypothetical protein
MSYTIEKFVKPSLVINHMYVMNRSYFDTRYSEYNNITNKNIIISKLKLQFIIKIKKIYFGDININKFYIDYLENYIIKNDFLNNVNSFHTYEINLDFKCKQYNFELLGLEYYKLIQNQNNKKLYTLSIRLNILDNKLIEIIQLIIKYINDVSDINFENICLQLEKYNIEDITIFPEELGYLNKYRYDNVLYFLNEFINLHI